LSILISGLLVLLVFNPELRPLLGKVREDFLPNIKKVSTACLPTPDIGPHLRSSLVTVGRILGHSLKHNQINPGGDLSINLRWRRQVLAHPLVDDHTLGVTDEGRPTGEQFI